jgi:hypothetical protein
MILCLASAQVLADGCEDLGDPGILGPGNGFVEAGVGTAGASGGVFDLDVPLDATVNQVFAYWGGEVVDDDPGDDQIMINGVPVTGAPLCGAGPVFFFRNVSVQGFRAELDLSEIPIGPGNNMITVEGMDFSFENGGASLVAVIDDGSGPASLQLRDGVDLAFINFPAPRDITEEQVFTFDPAGIDRMGTLTLKAGSVGEGRPNAVHVLPGMGAVQVFDDVFGQPVSEGGDGDLWDCVSLDVGIPAGVNMLTVQALSVNNPGGFDDLEASLAWLVGALSVPESICGDGIVDGSLGETCDPPGAVQNNGNLCRDDCTYCGDGVVDPGEECDPGADPECMLDCTIAPFCGDGVVDPGEFCDPPGSIPDPSFPDNLCREDCTYCGDGVVNDGEECDFNDPAAPPFCTTDCVIDEPLACRFTGGGVDTDGNWDHTLEDGSMVRNGAGNLPEGVDRYQFGGQAGANTALPPQPAGEWTHHQQRGPSGRFTFHGGTSSAPEGTRIVEIRCSDPDNCNPARRAPAKQLDFDGIGTFKSIGKGGNDPIWEIPDPNVTAEGKGNQDFDGTFHWFEVNIDDLGEPGGHNSGAPDSMTCPSDGFGEKGGVALADCDCPDFYRITIYDGVDAETLASSGPNTTDVMYEVYGYIDGGNLQIHPLTGFDGQ